MCDRFLCKWPAEYVHSVRAHLRQQHYPLAVGPDDVVHLRAHSLPR